MIYKPALLSGPSKKVLLTGTLKFFFYSYLMSMCNSKGYDRLKHLYIQKLSLVWRLLAVYLCVFLPYLFYDI